MINLYKTNRQKISDQIGIQKPEQNKAEKKITQHTHSHIKIKYLHLVNFYESKCLLKDLLSEDWAIFILYMRLRISSRVYDAELTEFIWSYNSLEWCSKNVCKYFFYYIYLAFFYIIHITY